MRLAFIHPSFEQRGGAENHLIAAMQGLAERGHTVDLFTARYDESLHLPLAQARFGVHCIGGRGFMEGIPGTWRAIRALSHALRGYDLALPANFPAHIWAALGDHGAPIAWLCMEPKRNLYPRIMYAEAPGFGAWAYRTLSDYRGREGLRLLLREDAHVLLPYPMRAALQRLLDRLAVRRVRAILANSPYTADKARQLYHHPRIYVTWAGVPLPALESSARPPERLILIPTRLEPIKNVATALRAVHLLAGGERLNGWQVVITGGGEEEARLRELTAELGLGGQVVFTGFVSRETLDELYARCAMVVYPSLAEPLGLPCAEAALYGKPVIASHQGGPATLVQDGVTGLLVDMTSPQALAEAIGALIADPEWAAAMGAAGRAWVEPRLGLPAWVEGFETMLAEVAS
jgi:glycosyltransferase involved in cell wall biosynthesis